MKNVLRLAQGMRPIYATYVAWSNNLPNHCNSDWLTRKDDDLPHCIHCGSVTAEQAVIMLNEKGTRYSGADWKYGWPHKFYFVWRNMQVKFYASHLMDASEDVLCLFNRLSEKTLGIRYEREGANLYFYAHKNYQAAGTIGGIKELG